MINLIYIDDEIDGEFYEEVKIYNDTYPNEKLDYKEFTWVGEDAIKNLKNMILENDCNLAFLDQNLFDSFESGVRFTGEEIYLLLNEMFPKLIIYIISTDIGTIGGLVPTDKKLDKKDLKVEKIKQIIFEYKQYTIARENALTKFEQLNDSFVTTALDRINTEDFSELTDEAINELINIIKEM